MGENEPATVRRLKANRDRAKRTVREGVRKERGAMLASYAARGVCSSSGTVAVVLEDISRTGSQEMRDIEEDYNLQIAEEEERQQPGSRLLEELPEFVTIKAAAAVVGLSPGALGKRLKRGTLRWPKPKLKRLPGSRTGRTGKAHTSHQWLLGWPKKQIHVHIAKLLAEQPL